MTCIKLLIKLTTRLCGENVGETNTISDIICRARTEVVGISVKGLRALVASAFAAKAIKGHQLSSSRVPDATAACCSKRVSAISSVLQLALNVLGRIAILVANVRATAEDIARKGTVEVTLLGEIFSGAARSSKISTSLTSGRESGGVAREPVVGCVTKWTLVARAADISYFGAAFFAETSDRIACNAAAVADITRAALLFVSSTSLAPIGIGIAEQDLIGGRVGTGAVISGAA